MLTIDGSQGEGGGQILRSSVALSAITGTPLQVINIRAGRKKPGLKRQHVTAVTAASRVCNAETEGVTVGSDELIFIPQEPIGGNYRFSMGTAGSTTLVFQTLFPILLHANDTSSLTLEGGTHNPFAPPFDFLQRAYLPLMQRMGVSATAELVRHGFFPAGGGQLTFDVTPSSAWKPLQLLERGKLIQRRVIALTSNLPEHIGERECDVIRRRLQWRESDCLVDAVESNGPGNVVLIELRYENVTEVFIAFGQKGRKAEQVGRDVARQAQRYLGSEVPVAEYLADQLMLPMALAAVNGATGSAFRTLPLSDHSTTHIDIIRQFLDVEISVESLDEDDVLVKVQ